jgi:hypothetical protein
MLLATVASEYVNTPEHLQEMDDIRWRCSEKARTAQRTGVRRWQNRVHNRVAELFETYTDVSDPGHFAELYFNTYGERLPLWALAHTEFSERFGDRPTEDCHMGKYVPVSLGDGENSLARQLEKFEEYEDMIAACEEAQELASLLPPDIQ